MIMCHMLADDHDELVNMATSIGMKKEWIQHEGTHKEHFDVSLTSKKKALSLGAIEISYSELKTLMRKKKLAFTNE